MKIKKIILSIITFTLGSYMYISGAASTINDEPARTALLAGLYWIFVAIALWFFKPTWPFFFNDTIIVGVTVIMTQYLILDVDILLPIQIAVLLIIVIFRLFKWI